MRRLTSLEICAGGGGQALGLEWAGFHHLALVEIDPHACATLKTNRPEWKVIEGDLARFDGTPYRSVDLLAGGVPCPPFSKAGRQLGESDERNLFPEAMRLVRECEPRAVMLENVRGLLDAGFQAYRQRLNAELRELGYEPDWRLLNASDFGVPQLRPRVALVAIRRDLAEHFAWPLPNRHKPPTVGEVLFEQMTSRGWRGAKQWRERANDIAPTIVGGSKKHGGPDLGPTRAKRAWATLGVDGLGIADEPPGPDFVGMPKLTVSMVARLQGFPDDWKFAGRKTQAYRQVGNAFPPPVAQATGERIIACLTIARMLRTGT
jgi:DNA (cytosine-5)-methyltransferase 1